MQRRVIHMLSGEGVTLTIFVNDRLVLIDGTYMEITPTLHHQFPLSLVCLR